jgi:methionine aminotransferase|tara:strand:+ start:5903 stop:7030 length:1128 start_codon:yes stop_codon:yes gene_type:complete
MSKLPHVGTTIFTVMSKMANEYGAINLAQGFPNFPIDERLNDFMKIEASSLLHQYAPMPGSANLRNAIAEMNKNAYGKSYNPDSEILVTAGATQAIFTAIQALINRDDEVVQLDPSYDCYEPAVILAGGIPVRVNLSLDFRPDWEKIKDAVNGKTKILIINNPHNPAGTLWSKEDFSELINLCEKYPKLLILSDEVYEFITFEKDFISIKQFDILKERMICVSSFGKTFHVTGWKIGYLIAPENFMVEIKKVHQFIVFCVHNGAQEALAKYAQIADFAEIRKMYQAKRDLFQNAMKESRFRFLPSEGSFFQLADYSEISKEKDTDFVQRLVKEHGVALIPVSAFYATPPDQHIVRFCFAKDDLTLQKSAEILCKI